MLKSYDEMTADQQLAYKMGYEAARSELRVAGRDDLRRGDSIPDALVEEAAKRIWERRHDTPYRPDRARHNRYHADYAADARAALSVLFPGEEE